MGALRWMLIVGGVAAIVAAAVWAWLTRQGRIDELVFRLHDVDPRVRARAGVCIIDDGSRRAAKELQTFLVSERDARARLAIALAVAGRAAQGTRGDFEQWAAAELNGVAAPSAPSPAPTVSPQSAFAAVGAPDVVAPTAARATEIPMEVAPVAVTPAVRWSVDAVRPAHPVAYAMADTVAPADRAIHWTLEPGA